MVDINNNYTSENRKISRTHTVFAKPFPDV